MVYRKNKRNLTLEQLKSLEQEGELWHRRMGHISPPILHKLKNVSTGVGQMLSTETTTNCKVCAQAKLLKKNIQ